MQSSVSPESLHHITTTADDNKHRTLQLCFKKRRTKYIAKTIESALCDTYALFTIKSQQPVAAQVDDSSSKPRHPYRYHQPNHQSGLHPLHGFPISVSTSHQRH
jgi:hypothetical protein